MSPQNHHLLLLLLAAAAFSLLLSTAAQIHDSWDWSSADAMSTVYQGDNNNNNLHFQDLMESVIDDDIDDQDISTDNRRSLFWKHSSYYISYGALSANRVPCPARSGRSYYTHNCFRARGPAHPYTRGCSSISRCRR